MNVLIKVIEVLILMRISIAEQVHCISSVRMYFPSFFFKIGIMLMIILLRKKKKKKGKFKGSGSRWSGGPSN